MSSKTLKKGEFLFKDGDKLQSLYLIQSGGVSLCLVRGKKVVDLFQLGANQILGENIILGNVASPFSAMATVQTQLIEVPIENIKQQYEAAPQLLKAIIKSLSERLRLASNEVKSKKLESDASPCPEEKIPSVFGALFHTVNHKSTKDKSGFSIMDWGQLKQYTQRVMSESPKRIELMTQILVKLGLAEYEKGKSPDQPDGPDEIQRVKFFDVSVLEAFFEFYQYYYYKGGGKSEILKVEDLPYFLLEGFNKLTKEKEVDRFGVVGLSLAELSDYCKLELDINLNNDHFTRLEQKGLFSKRVNAEKGVVIQFEKKEYVNTARFWQLIREIEKLNEKGFVDMNEKEQRPKKKTDQLNCPQCQALVVAQSKFCSECGAKLNNP
ncbi:MAG TPA: cyclic nucleotide-binding domain-containing protein [Pseudobdellovibrionaceae bacterium]|nr:cyclic nucleotide-binding domain-containing protein [Pseudobdellovibrionaceae bacterium]